MESGESEQTKESRVRSGVMRLCCVCVCVVHSSLNAS